MKTNTTHGRDLRQDVMAQIGQIPLVVAGTLTERRRARSGGGQATYYQLQRWRDGRNETQHVPAERVQAVREGLEGHRQAQDLLAEVARLDEATVLSAPLGDSKKKPTKR